MTRRSPVTIIQYTFYFVFSNLQQVILVVAMTTMLHFNDNSFFAYCFSLDFVLVVTVFTFFSKIYSILTEELYSFYKIIRQPKKRKKKEVLQVRVSRQCYLGDNEIFGTSFNCLMLDLSEGKGDSDVNKSNKSFVIWPKVKINRVFFISEIFCFIKF